MTDTKILVVLILALVSGCAINRPKVEIQIKAKEIQSAPEYQISVSL